VLQISGVDQLELAYDELIQSFVRNNQRMLAKRVAHQRRRLPPVINDQALFTKASPYGDPEDPFYHSPSSKIGSYYSPQAAVAAAILFEEFPANPYRPRKFGTKTLKLVREAQNAGMDAIAALKSGSVQVCYSSRSKFKWVFSLMLFTVLAQAAQ
jgi:hypothetical protein